MREPAALERVENLTVSYRSRLAVDAAACEAHPPRHSDGGVARRAQRGAGGFDFSQKHLVVSRGFAAAKLRSWGYRVTPERAMVIWRTANPFFLVFCAVG